MKARGTLVALLLPLALLLGSLTACGGVWVADARLALGYKGCLEGDEAVKADNLPCSSGQRIVRYDDRFFAVAGGLIYETSGPLEKDKEYLDMVRTCRA